MPGRQSSKHFLPLNPGRGSIPLHRSPCLASRSFPGKYHPLGNVKNERLFNISAYGAPKDPSRTPKDPSGTSQGPPGAPRPPKAAPNAPEVSPMPPKNFEVLKTQQKPMVFQCFHKPPNGSVSATQAPVVIPKDTPRPTTGPPKDPHCATKNLQMSKK